jgi:hypothetical protein
MRDPTRGGVATTLNEIAGRSQVGMLLQERDIPVRETVKGACEILGLDPLYVANEGKLVAIVAAEAADEIVQHMRRHLLGREAVVIGEVVADHAGMVLMKTEIGGTRILDELWRLELEFWAAAICRRLRIKSFNADPSAALRASSEGPHYPNTAFFSSLLGRRTRNVFRGRAC